MALGDGSEREAMARAPEPRRAVRQGEAHRRPPGWTAKQRKRFIQVLRGTMDPRIAARAAGMTVGSAYDECRKDQRFAARWRDVIEQGYGELELCLLRQSLFGTERTEVTREGGERNGKIKATKTVHSHSLPVAIRLLGGRAKAGAADKAQERPDDHAVVERVNRAMAEMRRRMRDGAGDGQADETE